MGTNLGEKDKIEAYKQRFRRPIRVKVQDTAAFRRLTKTTASQQARNASAEETAARGTGPALPDTATPVKARHSPG